MDGMDYMDDMDYMDGMDSNFCLYCVTILA